jgi:hypothetical protein
MSSPIASELQILLKNISETLTTTPRPVPSANLRVLCDDLRRIRQLLIDNPSRGQARDAFRHVGGFTAIIAILSAFPAFYDSTNLSRDEKTDFFELLKANLDVLSEALYEHSGNRKFFATRVEGGGWKALEHALGTSGLVTPSDDGEGQEQLFGQLLAFALAEESLSSVFRGIGGLLTNTRPKSGPEAQGKDEYQEHVESAVDADVVQKHLQQRFSGKEVLQNPDVLPVILDFWQMLIESPSTSPTASALPVAVIIALKLVTKNSVRNSVNMHGTQAISQMLPLLFRAPKDGKPDDQEARKQLQDLAKSLIPYGINRLDDACQLFRLASSTDDAAGFLLDALQTSSPPFIQFDLSLHGYSCVELPTLGRTFPPVSNSNGYTFTAWIRIDKFDPEVHTTVFGAYDATQESFLLAYLEKDTHNFILQTSVKNNRPSVRFRTMQFEEQRWYHVAIVHRRSRAGSLGSAKAALFVDGVFLDQIKCQYPHSPPAATGSTDSFASLSSHSAKYSAIQAFLGTPQDLALRLGRDVVSSKWSLSSFHLFQEALTDDLIAVHHRLGIKYTGNYQDLLGSFQTYRDSAELNRHNELLHPGREDKSDIASACRQKASNLMPESRVILSFSPSDVLDNEDHNHVNESRLIKSLSKEAGKMMQRLIRAGGNAVILNAAVPAINDALTQPHGVAILTGDPVVVVPQALDDTCWRIAGSAAVGLKLVELARGKDAVLRAMQIFFESVQNNWRNSEAVEKDGYQVLAGLIREKLGLNSIFADAGSTRSHAGPVEVKEREELALESLRMILQFVGYDENKPHESLLVNPLAYRVLLVDFDTWRKTPIATQKLYYSQFMHFAANNKNHQFNSKRLIRMRKPIVFTSIRKPAYVYIRDCEAFA